MKKICLFLFSSAAILILSACNNQSASKQGIEKSKSSEKSSIPVQYKFNTLKDWAKSLQSAGWEKQSNNTDNYKFDRGLANLQEGTKITGTYGGFAYS